MIKQHFSPIIWAIIGLHLVWAAGLWFEPSTSGVTGLATIVRMAGGTAAAELVLLVASIMAAIGLLLLHGSARVWSVIPQQILLVLSASGAVHAMINASFADGTLRPRWFLVVDQMPLTLIAVTHVVVVVRLAIFLTNPR